MEQITQVRDGFVMTADVLQRQRFWALLALAIALIGCVGTMYLSLGMSLKACPLCFYQRCVLFAIVAIVTLGWMIDHNRMDLYCLLCLPIHLMGLGIAAFHSWLAFANVLECPAGILGLGVAPYQSLTLFILLTVPLVAGALPAARLSRSGTVSTLLMVLLLGGVLTYLAKAGSPPLPDAPAKPYDKPPDTCRRPYVANSN